MTSMWLQQTRCGVTWRHAVASVSACCILRVLKQRSWPCEQVFDNAIQALRDYAAAQPTEAAACEGCSQAAQALVVTLRKSLTRLPFTLPEGILPEESIEMTCAVPPCPTHHALLQGRWLIPTSARSTCAPDAWGVLLASQARAHSCGLILFGVQELPRHFFLFICRELLSPLMANVSTHLEGMGDAADSTLESEVQPATAIVLAVRVGLLRPHRGPHASTRPWPDKGAGAPH
jgi:hypothetical protein